MRTPDPDSMMELCKVSSDSEAHIIVASLRAEGIPAHGSSPGADVFGGAMDVIAPRRVRVRRADLDRAREFLKENRELSSQIDWESVDWSSTDPADPFGVDTEGSYPMISKGLFLRAALVLAILLVLAFLFASFVAPGSSTDGVSPGLRP